MSDIENSSAESPLLPYATPSPLAGQGDLFRDGAVLVARDGIMLPPVCVLCGNPAEGVQPLTLKFTWDPSFHVTKTSTLQLRNAAAIRGFLCQKHSRRWRGGRMLGVMGMAASALWMFACTVVAIVSESSDVPRYAPHAIGGLVAGFALFIGFLFLFTLRTRTLKCVRIEHGYVYLEGVSEMFLRGVRDLRSGEMGAP
jgi:hypothetical protein